MKKKSKNTGDAAYRAGGFFNNLDIKGFKREAVLRGMPFQEVLDADIPTLYSYIVEHFSMEKQPELLDQFDDYVDGILKERGQDELISPSLRLGFIGERDEETGMVTKIKRVVGLSKKERKPRKAKTKDGIVGGTAKALTFELYSQGKDKKSTISAVLEKFPSTSDKSIGIWWNKANRKYKEKMAKFENKG